MDKKVLTNLILFPILYRVDKFGLNIISWTQ